MHYVVSKKSFDADMLCFFTLDLNILWSAKYLLTIEMYSRRGFCFSVDTFAAIVEHAWIDENSEPMNRFRSRFLSANSSFRKEKLFSRVISFNCELLLIQNILEKFYKLQNAFSVLHGQWSFKNLFKILRILLHKIKKRQFAFLTLLLVLLKVI